MLTQAKGIINIASMPGMIVNNPQAQSGYNSAKGGVIMLTKSMAFEWAKRGVRVNAIAPGYMRMPLTAHRFEDPENPVVNHKGVLVFPVPLLGVSSENSICVEVKCLQFTDYFNEWLRSRFINKGFGNVNFIKTLQKPCLRRTYKLAQTGRYFQLC